LSGVAETLEKVADLLGRKIGAYRDAGTTTKKVESGRMYYVGVLQGVEKGEAKAVRRAGEEGWSEATACAIVSNGSSSRFARKPPLLIADILKFYRDAAEELAKVAGRVGGGETVVEIMEGWEGRKEAGDAGEVDQEVEDLVKRYAVINFV